MDAAIAWLVQTILATLLIDKLDAWIRQVGLADDVEKLKSEIRRVKMVVSAVKERGIRNESLDESLALLVERLYEADDVVDELDYCRLQELVEGARPRLPADPTVLLPSNLSIRATRDEPAGMHGAEQVNEISGGDDDTPSNSVGKSRSVVWAHFTVTETVNGKSVKAVCRHCLNEFNCDTKTNGTSSMKKHLEKEHPDKMIPPGARPPNPSSTAEPIAIASSSSGKGRKRRSKAWDNFDVIENDIGQTTKAICKYCRTEIKCGIKTGTAGMLNHNKICKKKPEPNDQPPNPSSIGDATANATSIVVYDDSATRKRRRVDEESAEMTAANTHTCWDKATLSNMIRRIVSQLQEIQGQVREVIELHGSYLSSNSSHHQNATIDQNLRTSSLGPKKVYGRVAEKNFIIKMITEEKYDGVVVLPIVGIAGVGKTTLAQLVYNDPDVQRQFDQRIWIWVSRNFDEVRLTREMLNSISGERHEEINCFVKLQEILKSHANSMRLLIILDNVWDDMNDIQWDKMLAPLVTSHVILVTTRSISVAQRLGTLKPVKLGALANDDRWSLFKSRAFGFEKYEDHQSLSIIGQQIAEKLKGNPLAVVSTGELLRKKLSTEYWINILKNEDWKSMQLSGGIMAALKLSYDQLPYHLQQCFSYCSIFPNGYQFLAEELIGFWISQGFVKCSNSSQRLEDIGRCYLIDLVNMGFFEEVKREEPYLGSQVMYAICGLMHDFALMVSRTDCASIDNLECNKMPRTLRHLSIVTSSIYKKDQHGGISREQKFEGNLRNAIKSVRKLRTLVLLGHYDSSFLQLFEDIFREAYNLRLLHMSTRSADFLKVGSDEVDLAFPQVLSKLYHLRVLNVGSYTDPNIPDSIDNLVSLRRLVLYKGVYTSIATIGNMTSLQELHDLKFQISSNFEIIQPELDNFKTLKEIYEVVCKRNKLLEKLHLSGKESSAVTSVELLTMDGSGPSSEPSLGIAREVFESLKSCQNLKILQISGYSDAKSSIGLASNISFTSLLSLQLYGCGEWQKLPSLERFSFLTKLKLSNLQEVTEILVPSLEELVLFEMPKLERCSCTSVEGMNSSLRALQIEDCQALIEFDLFENNDKFEIELRPWLPGLRKLTLRGCPHLKVLDPLPPSSNCCELLINGVSALPYMEGSSSGKLRIGYIHEDTVGEEYYFDESSDELRILDDKILAFHNLRDLKLMQINGCQNLRSFWFEGFSHLVSLKSLTIQYCEELFSSDVMQEHIHCAFPSLKSLDIFYCGIEGKWLSLMLEHAPGLEELTIDNCTHITTVLLTGQEADEEEEEEEDGLSYLISARDRHLYVPLNYLSSLMEISVRNCPCLTLDGIKEGFSAFTSLKKLDIWGSPAVQTDGRWLLPTSLGELDISDEFTTMLQPYFSRDITSLKKLTVLCSRDLESLWLHSCTALENLTIEHCESLTTLEGLQSLGRLRHLAVYDCPDLAPWLQSSFINQAYGQLFSRMETIAFDVASVLTTSFCLHLTSLQRLKLTDLKNVKRLTDEQERALLVLKSLQELEFCFCSGLTDLPAGLHNLPSLKSLKIRHCSRISWLMETCLPRSLEELKIYKCKSLTTIEGLQSLGSLRHLAVYDCPVLPPWQLHCFFRIHSYDQLFSRLETLETGNHLTTELCRQLTSLQLLKLQDIALTDEDERALLLLKSLQELEFYNCSDLLDAPAKLHALSSLKRLRIHKCRGISNLPKEGLPRSLEQLEIYSCSKKLAAECRDLATSKLKVTIL